MKRVHPLKMDQLQNSEFVAAAVVDVAVVAVAAADFGAGVD